MQVVIRLGALDAGRDVMPGVFILVTFLTVLLGTVLVTLALDASGGAALAMLFLIALVGVVFVALAVSMGRQHPSHYGGDRHASENSFVRLDRDLEHTAVPEMIVDEDSLRYRELDRWSDDGAPRAPIDIR